MENYITDRLKNLAIVRIMRSRKPDGSKEAKVFARGVRQKVLDGAAGVFLWAQLILDQMEGKDDRQINQVLANPPANLYDMIYSVFNRISRDDEIDKPTVNQLLAWVAFARRPLAFGELDVILRSDFDATNWFLWDRIRGKFASIFRLRYPKNFDPDRVNTEEWKFVGCDQQNGSSLQPILSDDDENDSFDLDDSSNEDEEDPSSENNDVAENQEMGNSIQQEEQYEGPKESQADLHYSSEQKQTIVDFSHQWFRDFLVLEGDPSSRKKAPLTVGINMHHVEIGIVFDCFRCLRAALDNKEHIRYYVAYPAFHLFAHLASLNQVLLDEQTQIHILQELYWLMHEEKGCLTLFAALEGGGNGEPDLFWKLWLADNQTTSQLQKWFTKGATLGCFKTDAREWMSEAAGFVPRLLEPLAMTAAKMWLTKESYKDLAYLDKSEFKVWFIKGYRSLDVYGYISDDFTDWIYCRDSGFFRLQATEIEGLAEWAGLGKTTHWYTGVGWILQEGPSSNSVRAQELLLKAIEMDPTAWVAMEATAHSLGDDDQDYEKAISWMERAIRTLLEQCEGTPLEVDGYLLTHISRWKMRLGKVREAHEIAYNAWMKTPTTLQAVESYVDALLRMKDWDSIIAVMDYLDGVDNGYGISHLVKVFGDSDIAWNLGPAFRAKGCPVFIVDALELALQDVGKSGDTAKLIRKLSIFGDFYHDFYDKNDKAIRLWEEALARIADGDAAIQRNNADNKVIYANKLARLYFDMAVEILQAEPSVWRKCFRARILEQMNGLDDNNPTNDTAACEKLAMSLFQAGDENRACAIVAILYKTLQEYITVKEERQGKEATGRFPPTKDEKKAEINMVHIGDEVPETNEERPLEESSAIACCNGKGNSLDGSQSQQDAGTVKVCESGEETYSQPPLGEGGTEGNKTAGPRDGKLALQLESDAWTYTCDGCGYDAETKRELWFCDICYMIAFCRECLEKAKVGTLEVRFCNPRHRWHRVWPLDEEKDGEMAFEYGRGGKVQLKKEWLEELRNEWLNGE
ncbi:putative nacht and tpr domain protein [Rosellinia necatrix]|uniref:Putative nacht and tpr domain protein n=1 Tax=Rosellinia necatrix TaxID=77044 RepID=A0A1S8A6M1_ROSNE|nr:putative nacht and tpr domain protein [Rosellinia necatrix]